MFDEYTKDKILSGEKTVTRRLRKDNRRPAVPDHIHKIKTDRTKQTHGYIYIESCEKGFFGELTEYDALLEGFKSKEEYKDYFQRVNGSVDDDLPIWIITFKLINNENSMG